MSATTGTWTELMYANRADFTTLSSFTSEASLIAGNNEQPVLPALFFDGNKGFGRGIGFLARGIVSSTGTPTYTFQWRISTTAGTATLSGTSVGVTAAITTGNSVSNQLWEARLELVCNTPGQGTGNTTLSGAGYVDSAGFASPFTYSFVPSQGALTTWTSVLDNTLTQYVNLSVTSSASSSSNSITCKQLLMFGYN